MHPVLRNILAIIVGFLAGSAINMGFIMIGGSVVPPPPGSDVNTMEGMQRAMLLFEPKHFLFPFLAHALGTLAGAAGAAWFAASRKLEMAMVVGALFLAGGVAAVMMLPSPVWFSALDLIGAYIPMAYLGWKLATYKQGSAALQPG
ncbi:MAG: hypothetical protein V4723_22610 [Pseudomonadota bacterium]